MMNNMKIIRILSYCAVVLAMLACSGNVDTSSLPVLTVSDSEVDLASESQTVFTVTYNGDDVTGQSVIYDASSAKLAGNVFVPEAEGEYSFYAEYDGLKSADVQVSVVNSAPETVVSKFDRHVCVIEFTGAWCINCPEGYDKMKGILAYPQLQKYKDNIHLCAFHSDAEGTDTLAVAQTQDLIKLFSGLAYPSFTTDLRESGVLTDDGAAKFRPSIEAAFTEHLPHCGAAVSSVMNADKTQAEVTVKVTSEKTAQYRAVVLVVQDRIKGWQKTTTYPEGQDDYNHRHVVRQVVTEYVGTFTGEKLTDDGKIASGKEASKTWTVDIDRKWDLAQTQIYVLVLDADGYVNNMNVCAIDGGDSGYDLK